MAAAAVGRRGSLLPSSMAVSWARLGELGDFFMALMKVVESSMSPFLLLVVTPVDEGLERRENGCRGGRREGGR